MTRYAIWDPFVRVFHWALVGGFAANALFTDPESRLHDQIGYAVAALIALRLVWGVVGPSAARFASFWPTPSGVLNQLGDMATGRRHVHLGHSPLGALMIFNLLASMAGIALTGYLMTTDAYWGVSWVEHWHEGLVNWAGLSVFVHVGAVIWESLRTGVNLPRAMITGVKSVPDDANVEL